MLFVETPTNPSLECIDLNHVRKVSEETGIPFVADMTFSPPCTTRAFDWGAETVVYSLSKYFAGHNDVIGGAIVTKSKQLDEKLRFLQRAIGAILSPDECYRVIQGMKTLELRWKKSSDNALVLARYLSKNEKVKRVLYPGLVTHPTHAIAKRQMKNGFGAVVSFELHCQDRKKIKRFVDEIQKNDLVLYGESLASPETILAYPPLMSHGSVPKDVREKLGITDGFFRLSLGFEDSEDIIGEFERALEIL